MDILTIAIINLNIIIMAILLLSRVITHHITRHLTRAIRILRHIIVVLLLVLVTTIHRRGITLPKTPQSQSLYLLQGTGVLLMRCYAHRIIQTTLLPY